MVMPTLIRLSVLLHPGLKELKDFSHITKQFINEIRVI